jgi:hypothetical protein
VADGCTFHATGKGDVTFIIKSSSKEHKITLRETLFTLTMPMPLISISCMPSPGINSHSGKMEPSWLDLQEMKFSKYLRKMDYTLSHQTAMKNMK